MYTLYYKSSLGYLVLFTCYFDTLEKDTFPAESGFDTLGNIGNKLQGDCNPSFVNWQVFIVN